MYTCIHINIQVCILKYILPLPSLAGKSLTCIGFSYTEISSSISNITATLAQQTVSSLRSALPLSRNERNIQSIVCNKTVYVNICGTRFEKTRKQKMQSNTYFRSHSYFFLFALFSPKILTADRSTLLGLNKSSPHSFCC